MNKKETYKLSGVILFVPGILIVAVSELFAIGFAIMLVAGFLLLEGNLVMKREMKRKL